MVANPLTYLELEAFERKNLVRFSAWEADLIMRLDDAVMGVWAEAASKPSGSKAKDEPELIPADNIKGLKAMFRGLAVKKAAQQQAKATPKP